MNIGKTLFAQVMEFIPWSSFSRIVKRYQGDAYALCSCKPVNGQATINGHGVGASKV